MSTCTCMATLEARGTTHQTCSRSPGEEEGQASAPRSHSVWRSNCNLHQCTFEKFEFLKSLFSSSEQWLSEERKYQHITVFKIQEPTCSKWSFVTTNFITMGQEKTDNSVCSVLLSVQKTCQTPKHAIESWKTHQLRRWRLELCAESFWKSTNEKNMEIFVLLLVIQLAFFYSKYSVNIW